MRSCLAIVSLVLVLVLVTASGCNLYFGDDDDPPPPCAYDEGGKAEPAYYYEYRDPSTGTCIPGGGGGGSCDDRCGPCPAIGVESQPDMGLCQSQCTGLSESTCQVTSGCYAAYVDDPAADGKRDFAGCWQTAPSGPVHGRCQGLDAHECSRHDDCALVYTELGNATKFYACEPEPTAACLSDSDCGPAGRCDHTTCNPPPGCDTDCPTCGACPDVCYGTCVPKEPDTCALVDCGPGYHCEEQCTGDDGFMSSCSPVCVQDMSCAAALCAPGTTCVEVCTTHSNGQVVCEPSCVPDPSGDPGACYGTVVCAMAPPACPQGTTPGTKNGCYTGYCIPVSDCGPNDPGTCDGYVTCFANPPSCPSGTVPGIKNGCWSGYCIPQTACPQPTCEMLSTESACTSRGDCVPVYEGTNCTCYPGYCECETLTFDHCQSGV